MPPKRRSATSAAARSSQQRAQSTLSFGKDQANRVRKPGPKQQDTKISKKDPALLDITPAVAEPDLDEPTTTELSIRDQVESVTKPQDDPLDSKPSTTEDVLGGRAPVSEIGAVNGKTAGWIGDEETKARKVSESQIKGYWRAKERERKAPRVHQEGLTVGEKILREWDMSNQYGPCIGIARMKRWKRANMLGLNPPIEVLAVLLRGVDDGDVKSQRAHVDELMSSRYVET